jgi:hypothetical protein
LCHAVAGSVDVCVLLDGPPPGKRQPNLLLGAVRLIGGPVDEPEQRSQFTDVMLALQTRGGMHWPSNEGPGVVVGTADVDPGPAARFVLAHNQTPIALTRPHGHTLDWIAQAR